MIRKYDVAKNGIDEYALRQLLADRYQRYIIDNRRDHWHICIDSETDVDFNTDLHEARAYPDLTITRTAQITELNASAARPVKVKRGEHEVWCYVSAPMALLLKQRLLTLGQQVLVSFANADRTKPVVVG